jgi:hypothetical protein
MSNPPTEDYLAARVESCRWLGLDPNNLSPHEAIRADLTTVLRLWLDGSQGQLLAGGSADPSKLLAVVEALTKLVPETKKHHSDRDDPRQRMWEMYSAMRARGELAEKAQEPKLRDRIAELEAELAALKGGPAPAEPSPPPQNAPVASAAPLPPSAEERQRALAIANSPVPEHIRDTRPQNEPWRPYVEGSAFHDRWSNRNF